ncbi:MAG TPA: 30S ribosomal protein S6 [Solirubrobacteraceae bacterium]|jgi:small subunit ribosomal protein S6|nr:30S ribosomal protein S6 [Solirubrobacteraceae bacterium]
MTLPAPTYDLVLLLDTHVEEPTRAKLIADTSAAIESQGELLRHDNWGERALAYPIDRKASAEYHLLQFHIASTELIDGLDRTLRLADEVLRFRIIKLAPGVSAPPDMSSGTGGARRGEAEAAVGEPRSPAPAPAAAAAGAEPAGDEPASAETGAEAEPSEVPVGDAS